MEEKYFAIMNDFIGISPEDRQKLLEKGIMPGELFRVKSIEPNKDSFKVTIEFFDKDKKVTETLSSDNFSLYQKYDCDDIRTYDPHKDPKFKSQSQPGE